MAKGKTVENSTRKLQSAVNKLAIWIKTRWIKLSEYKSVHTDFKNNKIKQQPIFINGTKVPYANTAKYLGMNRDSKLRWKKHIKKKTWWAQYQAQENVLVAWTQFWGVNP
jgi:hypothetical protein